MKLRKNEIKVPKSEIISPEEFLHASVENEKSPPRNFPTSSARDRTPTRQTPPPCAPTAHFRLISPNLRDLSAFIGVLLVCTFGVEFIASGGLLHPRRLRFQSEVSKAHSLYSLSLSVGAVLLMIKYCLVPSQAFLIY